MEGRPSGVTHASQASPGADRAAERFGWPLANVCLFGWALATAYTNHAPLIPVLMERLGFTPTEAGLLSSVFFLSMSAVAVPAGILSDRFGPKQIGSLGLAVVVLSNAGLGYVQDFPMLLLIKILGGVGSSMAFIAGVRYVTVVSAPSLVHRAQGLYGGCAQLGAGTSLYLMPLLYALLDLRGAFFASAGLVVIPLALWVLVAPDHRAPLPPARLSLAVRSGTVWLLTLAHAGTFGLSILVGTWITTFLVRDLVLPLAAAGGLGSAVLVLGILSRPAGGILIDRRWLLTKTMIRISLLVSGFGLGLLALPGRPLWAALIAILVMGVTLSLPYSAVMNTASAAVPASPGAAVGIVGGLSLILIATGAPALGALYSRTESFSLSFGLLGAFCFLAFWLARLIRGEEELSPPDGAYE
ncbi:MAG: nitrate/nitrite transporter [Candidatus Methylomirabilia bacterium]